MFGNLWTKLLEKLVQKVYPDRNFSVQKIGKRNFIVAHDIFSSSFSLQGTYTYEEVIKLNELTTYSARFGYNSEFGPVALIGIPNREIEFAFFKDVWAYGYFSPEKEYDFEKYSDEEAKRIGNYTVFGMSKIKELAHLVKFNKISNSYDSRHKIKREESYRVFNMEFMLDGKYTYQSAKALVSHDDFRMNGNSITFATVGKNMHVGMIGVWPSQIDMVAGFRDVWEYGCSEPEVQNITFLTDEEAKKIDDFVLYGYDCIFPSKFEKKYPIVRIDRTFSPCFDFYDTPDGKDFRLTKRTELLRTKNE